MSFGAEIGLQLLIGYMALFLTSGIADIAVITVDRTHEQHVFQSVRFILVEHFGQHAVCHGVRCAGREFIKEGLWLHHFHALSQMRGMKIGDTSGVRFHVVRCENQHVYGFAAEGMKVLVFYGDVIAVDGFQRFCRVEHHGFAAARIVMVQPSVFCVERFRRAVIGDVPCQGAGRHRVFPYRVRG